MARKKQERYIIDSPENLLQANFDVAIENEHIFKRRAAKRFEKLNFLLSDEKFMNSITVARERLGIRNKYKKDDMGLQLRTWVIHEVGRNMTSSNINISVRKINAIIYEQIDRIRAEFKLGAEWRNLVCYIIASSGKKPKRILEDKTTLSHTKFMKADAERVEICFTGNIPKKEFLILWKILNEYWDSQKIVSDDILTMILEDKEHGVSWSKLGKKYQMPKENIRSRLRYYKNKK